MTIKGIHYGEKPGTDPETGKQCREITPKIRERLGEYEKGKRPKQISEDKVIFFEDGEPIVWYSKSSEGTTIELFDLMGFHPETGEELLPADKKVAEAWSLRHPPKEIENPQAGDFFDPRTGKPRLWYWKSQSEYKFFDKEGYYAGDPLMRVTKQVVDDYKKQKAIKIKTTEDINNKRLVDARTAGGRCDNLAANPTDSGKDPNVPSVAWDDLPLKASVAVEACTTAVEQEPSTLRFKYQLARAY